MSKLAAAEVCLEQVAPRYTAKGLWTTFLESLAEVQCRMMHKAVSRPVNGKYRCWTCLREFESNW